MTTEDFIKQELGIEIDEDNRFDDCELTWDKVIHLMYEFRKEGSVENTDRILDGSLTGDQAKQVIVQQWLRLTEELFKKI